MGNGMSIGIKEKKRQLDMLLKDHHGIKDANYWEKNVEIFIFFVL